MRTVRSVVPVVLLVACGLAHALAPFPAFAQSSLLAVPPQQPRLGRVIGVFDFESGEPVDEAQVTDMRTRRSATTNRAGLIALSFVDTLGSLIQVRKIGYAPQMFYAANSSRDTVPITILLKRQTQTLPTVLTRATTPRHPGDTIRALQLNGFYERQMTTGAPARAFVTSERIEKLSLLKDLITLTGREVCTTNLYINGIKVDVPDLLAPFPGQSQKRAEVSQPYRNGLDVLFLPREVLAVEMYRVSEVPAQYNPTRRGRLCGATLVWTR